jgi:hypothetical protein
MVDLHFSNWVRLVVFVFSSVTLDSLFLSTEENGGNEAKTGTGIKIRKAGEDENIQFQASGAQTPTVVDDNIYLFITRDFNRG